MTHVVALLNHRGGQAEFGRALTSAFRGSDVGLLLRTHGELAAEVGIEQSVSGETRVDPDRPLLWLSPGDAAGLLTPDERFLATENHAAARSIALLTRSAVLNRPSAVSACGLFPPSSAVAVRRVRKIPGLRDAVRPEWFSATLADGAYGTDVGEQHDYSNGRSTYGPGTNPVGPFRRRAAVPHSRLVRVSVVGTRAMAATEVPPATIDASLRIASFYELDLATVWWLLDDTAAATLARIECWIWDHSRGGVDDIAGAIAAWLSARLSDRTPAEAFG